jgi:outer membrane protein OmpA-like peptidoglycan-associated protein
LSLQLEKRIKEIGVGTDLAKTLNIPIIYFDLDKSAIRKDAAFELEKILSVMEANPKIKIDVRSHTDSRQTNKYNEKLSDRRAKATVEWLIKNGISSDRLTGKGYGESQLVNKCVDGVKCTEDEHQANRRSEFIIVTME